MKNLNEFTTGYPVSYANSQSQEYQGVLGPVDAETVQGNDRFNPKTPEGLHRLNAFINHFFRRTTLNPHYDLTHLKSRLNHLNLDFKIDVTKPLNPGMNTFKVTKGEVFGVTPTTDLSQGFDKGSDLPEYLLDVNVLKTEDGFKLEGKLRPHDGMTETPVMEEGFKQMMKDKEKRNKRIKLVKELWNKRVNEQVEKQNAENVKDLTGETKKEMRKDKKKIETQLKSVKR